jgi:hypothetical protein
MMLVQGDIKYVMKLPIGKNGAKVQCYIAALILWEVKCYGKSNR